MLVSSLHSQWVKSVFILVSIFALHGLSVSARAEERFEGTGPNDSTGAVHVERLTLSICYVLPKPTLSEIREATVWSSALAQERKGEGYYYPYTYMVKKEVLVIALSQSEKLYEKVMVQKFPVTEKISDSETNRVPKKVQILIGSYSFAECGV